MAKYSTHGYDFYFGEFRLPVTPASLNIKTPSKNETVTLINDGEINIVKKQGLREISFSFMLPHQKYAFVKSGQDDPNKTTSAMGIGVSVLGEVLSTGATSYLDQGGDLSLGGLKNADWANIGVNAADSAFNLVGETLLANNADFSPAYFIPILEDMKRYGKKFQFKVYRNDVSDLMNSAKKLSGLGLDWVSETLGDMGSNSSSFVGKLGGKLGASGVLMGKTLANQLMNGDKTKLPNTSIPVVIEDMEFEEDADSYGRDIMCNITLKEWKPYSTKRYNITENEDGSKTVTTEKNRESNKSIPQSTTVKKGDTLWNLCKKNLGDGTKYAEIAKLNGISNPNLIFPGQTIRFK